MVLLGEHLLLLGEHLVLMKEELLGEHLATLLEEHLVVLLEEHLVVLPEDHLVVLPEELLVVALRALKKNLNLPETTSTLKLDLRLMLIVMALSAHPLRDITS